MLEMVGSRDLWIIWVETKKQHLHFQKGHPVLKLLLPTVGHHDTQLCRWRLWRLFSNNSGLALWKLDGKSMPQENRRGSINVSFLDKYTVCDNI